MTLSIGRRLFVSVLAAFMAVAAVGILLVRWSLSGDTSQPGRHPESAQLGVLVTVLADRFAQHRDWSFLPVDATKRKRWLRETWAGLDDGRSASFSPALGERLALLDQDERLLAGAVASRWLIAFASIDTVWRPVMVDGQRVGFLVVAGSSNADDALAVAFLIDQQRRLAALAAFGVLLSALAAAALAAQFRRPIRELIAGARQLQQARFATRLSVRRSDELGELAVTFNRMAAGLEAAEHQQRQWMADTSHELRTPLSVLQAQIEAMQDGLRPATPVNLAVLLRQVSSLTRLVDALHALAREDAQPGAAAMVEIDAWQQVLETAHNFADKFRAAGLAFSPGTAPERSTVRCDPQRLSQVWTNLFENCVRYTAAGGRIHLHGAAVDHELHITLDDTAPGVPAPWLGRLGERFFRVDVSRNRQAGGSGLGLALCRQVTEAHHGRLDFSASPLGGLRATVVLPLTTR